ncbi:MAG: NADP-specific glutamate dehydrogenase, partial [Oscillospiraceae bacterium]
ENGIDFDTIRELKEKKRGRIKEYAELVKTAKFVPGCSGIWSVKCDIALPCATQNELDASAAKLLVENGVKLVAEGANMPCTADAVHLLQKSGVAFGPAKAANAGGVATSGLEMSQNSMRVNWSFEEVDSKLQEIMKGIYKSASEAAEQFGHKGDLVRGSNIAGFLKVAECMLAYGVTY